MTEPKSASELVAGRYRVTGRAQTHQDVIAFRAEDTRYDKTVAVVALRPSAMDDEAAVAAFCAATHRWLALRHPTLPRALDAGQDRGAHYVVAEWPGDVHLSRLIERSGGFSQPRAIDVAIQLCALFTFFRRVGLSTVLGAEDVILDGRGDLRCWPGAAAAAIMRSAEGSPTMDVARIGNMLRDMLRGPDGQVRTTPAVAHIIATATAPDPADRYADPATLAQALAAYWRARWHALPDRPAFRKVLPEELFAPQAQPPAHVRRAAREAPLWDSTAIVLLALAVILILGLIPLWAEVYARYAMPVATAPSPAAQATDTVLVPDLVGLDESTATVLLERAGLRLAVEGQEPSDQLLLGTVIRQTPQGGQRVEREAVVRVVLSSGRSKMLVPDVVGQPFAAAEGMLAESGLNAARQDLWSEQASDIVIEQDPPPGAEVVPGATVVLRISAGRTLQVGATLGDVARLLSAEPDRGVMRPGEQMQIALHWQALRQAPERYSVFVHMVSEQGVLIAQHDGEPAGGHRPTSSWAAGEIISDVHTLRLDPSTPTGAYTIRVGLYLPGANQRLPVVDAGRADVQSDALIVHTVQVVAP